MSIWQQTGALPPPPSKSFAETFTAAGPPTVRDVAIVGGTTVAIAVVALLATGPPMVRRGGRLAPTSILSWAALTGLVAIAIRYYGN